MMVHDGHAEIDVDENGNTSIAMDGNMSGLEQNEFQFNQINTSAIDMDAFINN